MSYENRQPELKAYLPGTGESVAAAFLGQDLELEVEDLYPQGTVYHWEDLPGVPTDDFSQERRYFWTVPSSLVAPSTLPLKIRVMPENRAPVDTETLHLGILDPSHSDPGVHNGKIVDAIKGISSTLAGGISLNRSKSDATLDEALWDAIRHGTRAISFRSYRRYMNWVLCGADDDDDLPEEFKCLRGRRFLPFNDTDAYRCLKVATEAFLQLNTKAWDDDPLNLRRPYLHSMGNGDCLTIPYFAYLREKFEEWGIGRKLDILGDDCTECVSRACRDLLHEKLCQGLLVELIWAYWHEEGMLVQTMHAISRRFQNISRPSLPDPLANLEIDPLRPLNNLIWGYIQDEQHRLTLTRRAYEYDHHYGLRLQGKAIPELRPADSRSKFLEAYHTLLELTSTFYRQDDDTTVNADPFPVLNGLKEVHLILSQGAHNQFGDLPSTARQEMLIQQWLLARPEFREFLPTRAMVRYPEPWMDRVDAMKSLQGWSDTSVMHFNMLAAFGEQVLLSIRFGDWNDVNALPAQAKNWARAWRAEIQGYIHSYRAVTGIDLSQRAVGTREAAERDLAPSFHIRRQMRRQTPMTPATPTAPAPRASITQSGYSPNGTRPATQPVSEPAIRRS
jgi:hypothetical protein